MFNWFQQREIQRQWDSVILQILECGVATCQPTQSILSDLCNCLSSTIVFYSLGYNLNKRTLRTMYALKRILADKRMFDCIKVIEYIAFGHTYMKKRFVNRRIKKGVLAHCIQMAQSYLDIIGMGQQSNPFAPGQTISKQSRDNND